MPRHIVAKLQTTKDGKTTLSSSQSEDDRLSSQTEADSRFTAAPEADRGWISHLQDAEGKCGCQPLTVYPVKQSLQSEGEIMTFKDK